MNGARLTMAMKTLAVPVTRDRGVPRSSPEGPTNGCHNQRPCFRTSTASTEDAERGAMTRSEQWRRPLERHAVRPHGRIAQRGPTL